MDYSSIFSSALASENSFPKFGFKKEKNGFVCKKNLNPPCQDFYVLLKINPSLENLSAEVFDSETDEKYALFEMPSANGSFVAKIRGQVKELVKEFQKTCFKTSSPKEKYLEFIKETLAAEADFPWEDSPDYSVYRCPSGKWFALVMKIKFRQLLPSSASEEEVWVVNLKAAPEKIKDLTNKKSVFPAWHMNKKHWITVLLTAATDFKNLCDLTLQSYNLVSGKKSS
ncbi:MAG: MmcQ/YjbR family DNA-binding protein [Treponema sp.]|nr:MmcQ/YjbR family DNA-binding protein [Treponema sp.]